MRLTVDRDANPRHRDPKPGARALEGLLYIRNEPVELDRPLHQAPDAHTGDKDQHRGNAAEPDQNAVRVMPDMLDGGADNAMRPVPLADARDGGAGAVLTATVRRASVLASAGTAP